METMAERLTHREFTRQRQQGEAALALVGMSNVGKSHWSARLRDDCEFRVYGCDDEIEARLGPELQALGYEGGIADVARWMGQPYDPQFQAAQAEYVRLEAEVTRQALESSVPGTNTVIDTTGSVVHLEASLRETLSAQTTVVYLQATPDMQAEMFRRYIEQPKPVVWGDIYRPEAGEDNSAALRRLYPDLLMCRSALYQQMAHVTIPQNDLAALQGGEEFLEYIGRALQ